MDERSSEPRSPAVPDYTPGPYDDPYSVHAAPEFTQAFQDTLRRARDEAPRHYFRYERQRDVTGGEYDEIISEYRPDAVGAQWAEAIYLLSECHGSLQLIVDLPDLGKPLRLVRELEMTGCCKDDIHNSVCSISSFRRTLAREVAKREAIAVRDRPFSQPSYDSLRAKCLAIGAREMMRRREDAPQEWLERIRQEGVAAMAQDTPTLGG